MFPASAGDPKTRTPFFWRFWATATGRLGYGQVPGDAQWEALLRRAQRRGGLGKVGGKLSGQDATLSRSVVEDHVSPGHDPLLAGLRRG